MSGYNVVDRAVINAPPEVIWGLLLAELRGGRRWWVPHNTFESGDTPPHEVGGDTHVTVHTKGVDKGGPKLRFTARTRCVDPPRRLLADYVAGDFRGSVSFELDPLDHGRTLFAIRWQARTSGRTRLLAKLVDIGNEHSKAARDALANLAAVIEADKTQALTIVTAVIDDPDDSGDPAPVGVAP